MTNLLRHVNNGGVYKKYGEDDMPKLTKRFVESIVPDPLKPLKFWDDEIGRFGVIVLPSGRRTYCVEYRNVYRVQKRLKIGVHGQITAEEARLHPHLEKL